MCFLNPLTTTIGFLQIPAHILGAHKITNQLNVVCWNRERLTIDGQAFWLSAESARSLIVRDCDLEDLDFSFLDPFDSLEEMTITRSPNIRKAKWAHLPPLPALQKIDIADENMPDLTSPWADNLSPLKSGLSSIELTGIGFSGDDTADDIFQWLLKRSSETLKSIKINRWSNLTRIPRHWPSFKRIRKNGFSVWKFAEKSSKKIQSDPALRSNY